MGASINGNFKGYYYQEGYIRTSCREFNLHNIHNRMIHLTNDAVQKKCEDYGKFEPGNKLSYAEFQNYLDKNYTNLNVCFERDILPQFKKLTTDCFRATMGKMDPSKRINTFEVYGLDFMLDENFKVYLIEVNTNPCLELASPLLARLIPSMLENSLRLAVDPLFPPPENFSQRKHVVNELCPENKYDLVFDERIDGPELCELYREKENVIVELNEEELSDSEEFDDEDE